jgi:hypothetical protein
MLVGGLYLVEEIIHIEGGVVWLIQDRNTPLNNKQSKPGTPEPTGESEEEMKTEYYYLKKGDIIKEGDEVDMCSDGWRDDPKWVKTTCIGEKAPDPSFPSHRRYRRILSPSPDSREEKEGDVYQKRS